MVKHSYADSDDEFPIEWVTPASKLPQPAQPSPSPYYSTSSTTAGPVYPSGSGVGYPTAINAAMGSTSGAAAGSSSSKPVLHLTDSPPRKPKAKRQRKTKDVEQAPVQSAHKPIPTQMPQTLASFPELTMSNPTPSIWDYPPPPPARAPAPVQQASTTPTQRPPVPQTPTSTPAKPRQRKAKNAEDDTSAAVPSSQKKGKAKAKEDGTGTGTRQPRVPKEKPEKREARFKSSCPQNIRERVERVMAQTLYMVDRRRNGDELREEFDVLGSTGNVYKVIIEKTPSCTCPDFLKGNHCKHILFIFLKVLQVSQASGHWYQKALLTSELSQIFAQAPLAPNALANPRIREAYARATGKTTSSSTSNSTGTKKRIPGPEDDCPICYENMHRLDVSKLTFCAECGNGLHGECFGQWAKTAKNNLTCVFCRAKWVLAGGASGSGGGAAAAGGGRRTAEGYLNLGAVAGLSPVRDTSTYYHGPRYGQRHYGYQEYEEEDYEY